MGSGKQGNLEVVALLYYTGPLDAGTGKGAVKFGVKARFQRVKLISWSLNKNQARNWYVSVVETGGVGSEIPQIII